MTYSLDVRNRPMEYNLEEKFLWIIITITPNTTHKSTCHVHFTKCDLNKSYILFQDHSKYQCFWLKWRQSLKSESRGTEYEAYCLLGCVVLHHGKHVPMFWRNMLPPMIKCSHWFTLILTSATVLHSLLLTGLPPHGFLFYTFTCLSLW
jgi:hypothetical protein